MDGHSFGFGDEGEGTLQQGFITGEVGGQPLHLSVLVAFATPYVVIYDAAADYDIHHLQAGIDASCHTGADEAVGAEAVDQFYGSGGSVHLADAALHQDEGVSSSFSFGEFEGASTMFFSVVEQPDNLVVLHAHGGYDSYFHTLK